MGVDSTAYLVKMLEDPAAHGVDLDRTMVLANLAGSSLSWRGGRVREEAKLLVLITDITAGFLAHWDGSSLPGALMRAGGAFAVALTVLCGIIALGVALPI
uniref:hypothetical protein n=1 Tax=Streptomyces sp. NBC_01562 TaxID=2975879 RepID=UPI002F915D0D